MKYPVDQEKVQEVCKMGQGHATCRYLTHSTQGWECVKKYPGLKAYLDKRVEEGTLGARGDNCEGVEGVEE